MRAYKATVEILLDPRIVGPDASTEWTTPASAADGFSAMLSDNPDILDWRYVRPVNGTYDVIDIDPDTYDEGDMDSATVIERVEP
jgi:hypothetical protein